MYFICGIKSGDEFSERVNARSSDSSNRVLKKFLLWRTIGGVPVLKFNSYFFGVEHCEERFSTISISSTLTDWVSRLVIAVVALMVDSLRKFLVKFFTGKSFVFSGCKIISQASTSAV